MDVDSMTDGQVLAELRRYLAFCEFLRIELAKRANGDDDERRRYGTLPADASGER